MLWCCHWQYLQLACDYPRGGDLFAKTGFPFPSASLSSLPYPPFLSLPSFLFPSLPSLPGYGNYWNLVKSSCPTVTGHPLGQIFGCQDIKTPQDRCLWITMNYPLTKCTFPPFLLLHCRPVGHGEMLLKSMYGEGVGNRQVLLERRPLNRRVGHVIWLSVVHSIH